MAFTPVPFHGMNAMPAATDHRSDARVYLRSEVLDRLLAERGITTVTAAADFLGVDPGTIHRFRGGRIKAPSGELMLRWAKQLGVTVEELWENRGPDAPPPSPPPSPPKPPAGPSTPRPPSRAED